MDESDLIRFGLNKNEARVYLTLLKHGPSSAGILIKETEFHRNIVYDNLEKLIDKGLVSFIIDGKKKIFKPNPAEMITQLIDKEQEQLDEKKKIAEELKKNVHTYLNKSTEEQDATMYRGINGLKTLMKDTIKEGKSYVVFGAPKESVELMGETYWQNYNLKREEQKITIRMLFNEDLRTWSKKIRGKITQIRFLHEKFDSITETMIYGDKVAIIVWTKKPIATVIKDKHLAKGYTQYFGMLWKQSKE